MHPHPIRTATAWAALLILPLLAVRPVEAAEYTVQRRDYRFETFFEVGFEGAAVATVQRARWRQPLRSHYVLYSADGRMLGQASTRLFNLGLIFPWATTLDIADSDGGALLHLSGDFFTAEVARFRVTAPDGQVLAVLHVDQRGSSCLATSPASSFEVLARYYRNRLSDDTAERWDFTTVATGPVPDVAWQLIGAFLADVWQ